MGCCRNSLEVLRWKQPGLECMKQPDLCDGCGFVETVVSVLQAKGLVCGVLSSWKMSVRSLKLAVTGTTATFLPKELQMYLNHLWAGTLAAACLQKEG